METKCEVIKNLELNGIEIEFDSQPSDAILAQLKRPGNRWRYKRKGSRRWWWIKYSKERYEFALKLCALNQDAKLALQKDDKSQLIRNTTTIQDLVSLQLLLDEIKAGKLEVSKKGYDGWWDAKADYVDPKYPIIKKGDLFEHNNFTFRYRNDIPKPKKVVLEQAVNQPTSNSSTPGELESVLKDEPTSKWPYPANRYGLRDFIKDEIRKNWQEHKGRFISSGSYFDADFILSNGNIIGIDTLNLRKNAPLDFYTYFLEWRYHTGHDLLYQVMHEFRAEMKGEEYTTDHLSFELLPDTKYDYVHIPVYERLIDLKLAELEVGHRHPIYIYFRDSKQFIENKLRQAHPELINIMPYRYHLAAMADHFNNFVWNYEQDKTGDWKYPNDMERFRKAWDFFKRIDKTLTKKQLFEYYKVEELLGDVKIIKNPTGNIQEQYKFAQNQPKVQRLIHGEKGRVNNSAELTDKNGINLKINEVREDKQTIRNRLVYFYLEVLDKLNHWKKMRNYLEDFKSQQTDRDVEFAQRQKDRKNSLISEVEKEKYQNDEQLMSKPVVDEKQDTKNEVDELKEIREAIGALNLLIDGSDSEDQKEILEAIESLELLLL